jgi:transcription termination factor Rho
LDRKLAERRIFPSIDVKRSGTRKEELLLSKDELTFIWQFRKNFSNSDTAEVAEMLIDALKKVKTNKDLVRAWPKLVK